MKRAMRTLAVATLFALGWMLGMTGAAPPLCATLHPENRQQELAKVSDQLEKLRAQQTPDEVRRAAIEMAKAGAIWGPVEVVVVRYKGRPNATSGSSGLVLIDERFLTGKLWLAVLAHEMGHLMGMHTERIAASFADDLVELGRLRRETDTQLLAGDTKTTQQIREIITRDKLAAAVESQEYEAR